MKAITTILLSALFIFSMAMFTGCDDDDTCQNTICNSVCVDTDTDDSNCGACGSVCGPGTTCVNGACQ